MHRFDVPTIGSSALASLLVTCAASAQCSFDIVGFGAGESGETGHPNWGQSAPPSMEVPYVQVSGGVYHSAGVLEDGTVVCWGSNAFGSPSGVGRVFGTNASGAPIANGVTGDRVQIQGAILSGIAEVSAGELHTVARRADGGVVVWGSNSHGQLGVPAGLVASRISAGSLYTLALRADGSVVSWGSMTTVPASASSGVIGVSAGYEHSLAWKAGGFVAAWGRNDFGQSSVPVELPPSLHADGGVHFSIALGSDGIVRAWGDNRGGQCAGTNADGTNDLTPGTGLRTVKSFGQPLSGVVAISSGGYHSLALRADGTVVAWGAGPYIAEWSQGQVNVPAISRGRAVEVDAGYLHSFVRRSTNTIDCDENGRIDCVEIELGQSSDADGDGVLDTCEPLLVPSQYASVQAAIDAVAVSYVRVIEVEPGTYSQAFSLNGKNIVVRGATNGATVLDGAGLSGSIVRFAGGEPATAGVENLVFRNGTVGSLIYPGAPFDVGGAIYGSNSSAFIRGCRFESCSADFGGAVYLIYSRSSIENCVFDRNTGINEGGGLFLYESTSRIAACLFDGNDVSVKGPGAGSAFKAVGAEATGESVELVNCTFTGNRGLLTASAIEYYENVQSNPGVLRISGCTVTANVSGIVVPDGAAGLRVLGRSTSCVITGGTSICSNSPRDTSGPFLIEGSASICGCFADVTGDGLVNGGDLGALLGAWGAAGPAGVGDVNHDGLVDAQDLGILLSSWGACPN